MYKLLFVVGFLSLLGVGYSNPQCRYVLARNETATPCALVDATIRVKYEYNTDSGERMTKFLEVGCPDKNDSVVECSNNMYMMFDLPPNSSIIFEFTKNSNDNKWSISHVNLTILHTEETFPNSTFSDGVEGYITDLRFENIDSKMSYKCNANETFTTSTNTTNVTMSISFADFQVQAFDFDNNNGFGNARRCDNDVKGSKIVPIAVGAALAGLVIIVLIAYIIGRLRSRRQSSYEALS